MPLLKTIKKCKVEEREVGQHMHCRGQSIPNAHQRRPSELMYCWELQIEASGCKDEPFHLEELLEGVEPIADEDVFLGLPGMDLVVLGGHEERSNPQQLKIMLVHPRARVHDHEVDELNADMHGLLLELELFAHLQQPPQEDCSHLAVNSQLSSLRHL